MYFVGRLGVCLPTLYVHVYTHEYTSGSHPCVYMYMYMYIHVHVHVCVCNDINRGLMHTYNVHVI